MRKIAALFSAVLAVAMLASCTGDPRPEENEPTPTEDRYLVVEDDLRVFVGVGVAGTLDLIEPSTHEDSTSVEREAALLEYEALLGPESSPGLYYPDGPEAAPVIRVFQGVGVEALEKEHSRRYPEIRFESSQYTFEQLAEIELLTQTVKVDDDEAFGAFYVASDDIYQLSGNVSAEKVANAFSGHHYSFMATGDAGRALRISDTAPHHR